MLNFGVELVGLGNFSQRAKEGSSLISGDKVSRVLVYHESGYFLSVSRSKLRLLMLTMCLGHFSAALPTENVSVFAAFLGLSSMFVALQLSTLTEGVIRHELTVN